MTKKIFVKLTGLDGQEMVVSLDATYAILSDNKGNTIYNGMMIKEKYADILKKLEGYIDIV